MRRTLWIGFWIFLIDQISKYVVVHMMNLRELGRVIVWPPFIEFRMAWNRGVNFGLFAEFDMRWVLIAIAVAITGAVLWWMRKGAPPMAQVFAGLLVGGAVGNIIDRLLYGAVADFLNVSCCGFENPYAFNVADVAIFVGALGLVAFGGEEPKTTRRPPRNKTP